MLGIQKNTRVWQLVWLTFVCAICKNRNALVFSACRKETREVHVCFPVCFAAMCVPWQIQRMNGEGREISVCQCTFNANPMPTDSQHAQSYGGGETVVLVMDKS